MSLPADLVREDIGFGVWMSRVGGGVIVGHFHSDGEECCGAVVFDMASNRHLKATGRPLWEVRCSDPLTLFPSIGCPQGSLRGFIKEGKWHPIP